MKSLLGLIFLSALLAACGGGSGDAEVEYTALGASDTLGVGATPVTNGYVFLIEDALDDCGQSTDLLNLGIPGAQLGAVEDVELPVAVRDNPDLVTLWPGPNDLIDGNSPQSFELNLNNILSDLRSDTNAFIVLANLPDLTQLPTFQEDPDPDVTRNRIAQFNAVIARQAALFNVPVADLSDGQLNDSLVSEGDGFHPSDRGYQALADAFLAIIRPQFCGQ